MITYNTAKFAWDLLESVAVGIGAQGLDAVQYMKDAMMLHKEYLLVPEEKYVLNDISSLNYLPNLDKLIYGEKFVYFGLLQILGSTIL